MTNKSTVLTRKVLSLLTSASFIYLETTIYEPMTFINILQIFSVLQFALWAYLYILAKRMNNTKAPPTPQDSKHFANWKILIFFGDLIQRRAKIFFEIIYFVDRMSQNIFLSCFQFYFLIDMSLAIPLFYLYCYYIVIASYVLWVCSFDSVTVCCAYKKIISLGKNYIIPSVSSIA